MQHFLVLLWPDQYIERLKQVTYIYLIKITKSLSLGENFLKQPCLLNDQEPVVEYCSLCSIIELIFYSVV